MKGFHSHPCVNHVAGCENTNLCDGEKEGTDPPVCGDAIRFGLQPCADCFHEPPCDECGAIVRLHGHDKGCTLDPNYDPTPWDPADVTSGVGARELNDPTHPRNREAHDLKDGWRRGR